MKEHYTIFSHFKGHFYPIELDFSFRGEKCNFNILDLLKSSAAV